MRQSFDGFERRRCTDEYGRAITYYVYEAGAECDRLVIYVQGSGCHSLFVQNESGIHARQPGVLATVAQRRATVLAVEKPGVRFLDNPGKSGRSEQCRTRFLTEHTLERWSSAVAAAVRSHLRDRGYTSVALVGQSEGGIVAAAVARQVPEATHVALLSSSGPTQLTDLLYTGSRSDCAIREALLRIAQSPDSVSLFQWGHPHRRWSSFLATSALEQLGHSQVSVLIVHGTRDSVVPILAARVVYAELLVRGRDVRLLELDAGHNLRPPHRSRAKAIEAVFVDVLAWLCNDATRGADAMTTRKPFAH